MPSAFESLFATTAAVSLLDFHGEPVTRIPGGSSVPETVTAIVQVDPPEVTTDRGDGRVFRPKVMVADIVTVSSKDRWIIGGVEFQTERICEVNGDGLRPIELVRNDQNIRGVR